MVPFSYVARSLATRKARTVLTVLGVALAVAIYAVMGSVADKMARSFRTTGEPEEVVLTQAGSVNVDFSSVERQSLGYLQTLDAVASQDGTALVSPEIYLGCVVSVHGRTHDVYARGVTAVAPAVYRNLRLASGSWPGPGLKAAVGRSLASRLGLKVGDRLAMERQEWTVAGLLDGEGRVYDNEIWVDLDELAAATNRVTYTSYTVRAKDAAHAATLVTTITEGRRFPLMARSASDFYLATGGMSLFMAALGRFISFVIAIGAVFGGMNTMYAAVAGRRREIAILRALGFGRRAVLLSFLGESLLIGLAGGLAGLVLGFGLSFVPLDLPYSPGTLGGLGLRPALSGLVLALAVGAAGGLLPALHASRLRMVEAMR